MKTVRFETLGCRLNQAEEAAMAGDFLAAGWKIAFGKGEADVVVLHSCAVTRQAERETLQRIRALKRGAASGRLPVVAVTGCAASALDARTLRSAGADVVLPRSSSATPLSAIEHIFVVESRDSVEGPGNLGAHAANGRPVFRYGLDRAILKVQDGCDFRCTYCIVPLLRGPSTSTPFGEAVESASKFAACGYREIVVTGCNLACYSHGGKGLPELVSAICEGVDGTESAVSLGSIEPGICDDGIIETMLRHPNLKRRIHLPIQSASSAVLKAAGRRYDAADIREILSLYFERVPGIAIGADFITGLPGEDEEAFSDTCALVRDFAFERLHVFPYSPRQGTAAPALNPPPRSVAKERASRLRALHAAKDR